MACSQIVNDLLDQDIPLKTMYIDLFQKSLYEIGQLWEVNKISVAKEHLVTAITENLLSLLYPRLFKGRHKKEKTAIISCTANEYHQVGGKIISDIFESHGWNSHFLGANTPIDHLVSHIDEIKPDLVGLSLSIYFNMPTLKKTIETIESNFSSIDILIGGQAFNWGDTSTIQRYKQTIHVSTIDALEKLILE